MDPNNPNLYVYCANNPLVYIDPTGQWNEESKWYKPWTWFNKSDDAGGGGGGTGGGGTGGGGSTPTTPSETGNTPSSPANNQDKSTESKNPYDKVDDAFYKWLDTNPHERFNMEQGLECPDKFIMKLWHLQEREKINLADLTIEELDAHYLQEVKEQTYISYANGLVGFAMYSYQVQMRIEGTSNTWYKADGSMNYPPNNGAISGTEKVVELQPGQSLGRYGNIGPKSDFVTAPGASPDSLSLPPNTSPSVYTEIRVLKPIPGVTQSTVAPWGGSSGMGIQYQLPKPLEILRMEGYITY